MPHCCIGTALLPLVQWEYKESEVGQVVHTFTVRVRHKYGASVQVSGEASFEGTQNMRTV